MCIRDRITDDLFLFVFLNLSSLLRLCRTGGPGHEGISMILVEKTMPGVKCRQMDCTGVWASGTTYITFEDVKVPVENLIGKEGHGFRYVVCPFYSLSLSLHPFALRSEKTRRLSIDATK